MQLSERAVAEISALLSPGAVSRDPATLARLSMDIFEWAEERAADILISPSTPEEAGEALRWAHANGLAVAPRGGGMSYTRGFQPQRQGVALLDLKRLDRIRSLSVEDRIVVVEAGATWTALEDALRPHGLRPAVEGPISGAVSTIGGAMSQNMPSGLHHVMGLEVVLADGRVVKTGALARPGHIGAMRASGPDLTGLFLGDCGALAVKTAVALRLVPRPLAAECASFGFETPVALAEAMAAVQARNTGVKVMGLAARNVRDSVASASWRESFAILQRTVFGSGSLLRGLGRAGQMAVRGAGKTDLPWGLHLTAEGETAAMARATLAAAIMHVPDGGVSIAPTVPLAMLSRFYSVRGMLGLKGERWAPVHGIFTLSRIGPVTRAVEDFFVTVRPRMKAAGITYSLMLSAHDTNVLIEPMLYWPDSIRPVHASALRPDLTARFAGNPENPTARDLARELRYGLRDLLMSEGAMMAQLGRFYPYDSLVEGPTFELAQSIKSLLDPEHLLNPGSLGLEGKT